MSTRVVVQTFRGIFGHEGKGEAGETGPAPCRLDEDLATPRGVARQGSDCQFGWKWIFGWGGGRGRVE